MHALGPRRALDGVNPWTLELETAKVTIAKPFDIRSREVAEMIKQRIGEEILQGFEFDSE